MPGSRRLDAPRLRTYAISTWVNRAKTACSEFRFLASISQEWLEQPGIPAAVSRPNLTGDDADTLVGAGDGGRHVFRALGHLANIAPLIVASVIRIRAAKDHRRFHASMGMLQQFGAG